MSCFYRFCFNFFMLFISIFSLPALIPAQDYQPAIVLNSFLNMRFYNQNGGFLVEKLQIVFPPEKFTSAEFVVRDGNGKTLASVPLRLEKWDQFPVFDGLVPNGAPGNVKLGSKGDYVMSVVIDGKETTRMPFTLEVKESGDPFNPQKQFSRSGMWKDLAFFSVETEKPENALEFNFWSSKNELGSTAKTGKVMVYVMKGDQVIAESRSAGIVSNTDWQFISTSLRQPKSAGGNNFTLAMLTGQDGDYAVVLKENEKEIKRFSANVKSGKLQRIAECDLNYKPHASFISPRMIDTSSGSGSRYKMLDAYWLRGK